MSNFGIELSGLESVFSEAHQKYRVNTEASHPSHLQIRERISGETWCRLSYEGSLSSQLVQMYTIIFGHCDIDPHMFLTLMYKQKRLGTIISR